MAAKHSFMHDRHQHLKKLPAPETGNRVYYDANPDPKTRVTGLGLRVTKAGARSFVFNYRNADGAERRLTIGAYGPWTLEAARERAAELARMVDNGDDPLAEREEKRSAPTVADLCQQFDEDHIGRLRPKTAAEYRGVIRRYILPELRHRKVAEVTFADIDRLHTKISKSAPYRANRVVAVLSKMFSLAVRWKMRPDNPAKGIERNQEHRRTRYLSPDELGRLSETLAEHEDQQAANVVRLLLLTGARRTEVLSMRWDQLDLDAGVWVKPGATVKQKTEHRVPLSEAAVQLLSELPRGGDYVFPGGRGNPYRAEIKRNWKALCEAAGIEGARVHDLRHTYASILASSGLSLPVIGALLGHTQPATTARYSHLLDDPLRQATERAAAVVTGKPSAEVVELRKGAS